MKCELIQYQLGAYTAGELPHESSLFIEQHLRTCPACQAWHKEVQEMALSGNSLAKRTTFPI